MAKYKYRFSIDLPEVETEERDTQRVWDQLRKADSSLPATYGCELISSEYTEEEEQLASDRWDKYTASVRGIESRITDAIDGDVHIIYSATSEKEEDGSQIDNLDDIAVEGEVIFSQSCEGYEESDKDFQSDILKNPTWLDVCKVANESLETTGDCRGDHIFLESVYITNRLHRGAPVYEFSFGS